MDTPETDAEEEELERLDPRTLLILGPMVRAEFARELETERDEARERAEHCREALWHYEKEIRNAYKEQLPWES